MTARFDVSTTPLEGLTVIQRKPINDNRGYFERIFCAEELRPLTGGKEIVQINHTFTTSRGTVRGLHFQKAPDSDAKIVSCLRGEVFDVAVDIRDGSPTFLRWHAELLSETNHRAVLLPEGFAHGFQTLSDGCELLYLHTAQYSAGSEAGLNVNDPALDIHWPLPIIELSRRDANFPLVRI